MIAHQDAVIEHHDDAEASWATLEATLKALTEGAWTIHTDFATAAGEYAAYVNTYYAGSIPEENAEAAVYAAFTAEKAEYEAKVEAAKGDAQAIKDAIGALDFDSVNDENATTVGETVADIYTMIEDYKTNYGCDITTCDSCGISEDEVLKLAKVEAKADYTQAYTDFTTTYATELAANPGIASSAAGMLTTVENMVRKATDVGTVTRAVAFAQSSIDGYVTQLTTSAGA